MFDINMYIIEQCQKIAGTDLKPCIKQEVYAMLVTKDGVEFFGANWMSNCDVTVCPRIEFGITDYGPCKETCNQEFHAECSAINACINAGHDTTGSVVYVVGHTICCVDCQKTMAANGVSKAIVVANGHVYNF